MSETSHVAFIAIRMAPGELTTEPQAIVVGTMPKMGPWNDGDWRYVTYPLSTFLKKIGKTDLLSDAGDGVFAKVSDIAQERFDAAERTECEKVFPQGGLFKDAYLDAKITIGGNKVRRAVTAFPLRGIEKVFFYSFLNGDGSSELKRPFCALDTARVVVPNGDDKTVVFGKIQPAGADPGSRIVLVPDFSDPNRQGLLSGVALHLQMKVAVNGHSTAARQRSATDPLMLLDAGVVNGPSKELWFSRDMRGANFDVLRLRCSLGDGKTSDGLTIDDRDRDLFRFAFDVRARAVIEFIPASNNVNDCGTTKNGGPYLIDAVPAVDRLGLPPFQGLNPRTRRRFGFRLLDGTPSAPLRIGWRFELIPLEYGRPFAQFATGTFIPHGEDGNDLKGQIDRPSKITIAEEQRLDDVGFDVQRRGRRTALTLRFVDDQKQTQLDHAVTAFVLSAANQNIGKIQAGLKRVRDGRPISLLPTLAIADGKALSWNVTGFLTDATPNRRLDPNVADNARGGELVVFEPVTSKDVWQLPTPDAHEVDATATFRLLTNEDRKFSQYKVTLGALTKKGVAFQPLAALEENDDTAGTLLRMTLTQRNAGGTTHDANILIGALELTLADAFPSAENFDPDSRLRFVPLDDDPGGNPDEITTAVDATVNLPILRVDPGGQDESDRDVAVSTRLRQLHEVKVHDPDPDAPLLLPLSPNSKSMALKLAASEVATRDRDHTLALSLQSIPAVSGATDGPARVLVIDPRPFRIAAVEYQPIGGTATSESDEVAVWNADGEGGLSWRVRDDGQSVGLELPPQVIGEAMEKNRDDLGDRPKDIAPNKPAAARFGSPTRLRIDPTFADTRFREPGWNLRRILGNALQRLPGARLLDLRLELLYGLLTRVRADDLLLTELAGAIGEPAFPIGDTITTTQQHVIDHKKLVDDLLTAERFRLAVDKIYRLRPDDYLRIEDGVSFKLRLRKFGDDGSFKGGPKTPLRWPIPGGIPDDTGGLIKPEILQQTFSAGDDDRVSFPGGLAWALESANILMKVYSRPKGDGGNVAGVYLSARGGYGSQRALFDSRKSIVETETTQGRVQRYRLERVGRIGCLWHPAKHVIVYERSVVPSPQFYNNAPIGKQQDEHAGRAVLRKVEEYVEIPKPVRQYPEDGASIRAAGCLIAAEFKSTKIHVDSARWGCDVRREGFRIPLWNTDFAGLSPDPDNPDDPASVYPKPQIRLTFAGRDGNVSVDIDEPAKLVFYTSVLDEDDDRTDLWKPVRDIDFCDAPKISAGALRTQSADLTDAMLPPEPEHVPGYESFTIGLVASKEAVALTHGRVEDGPIATLRNVTLARATALSTTAMPPTRNAPEFGRGLGEKVANVRAELDRQVGLVLGTLEKLDRDTDVATLKKQANKAIDDACNKFDVAIKNIDGLKQQDILRDIVVNCDGITSQARSYVDGQLKRFRTVATELLGGAAATLDARIDAAGAVIEGEAAAVDQIAARVRQGAGDLRADHTSAEVLQLFAELRGLVAAARKRVGEVQAEGKAAIDTRIGGVKVTLAGGLDDLNAQLDAAALATVAKLDGVRTLLGSVLAADADAAADAVDGIVAQIADCAAKVHNGAGTITDEARKAAKDAKQKIADARKQLTDVKGKAPEGVRHFIETIDAAMASVAAAASYVERAADADFAELTTALDNAVSDFRTAAAEFRARKDQLVAIGSNVLTKIEDQLKSIVDGAIAEAKELIKFVHDNVVAPLLSALDDVDQHAQAELDALAQPVLAQLTTIEGAIPQNVPPNLKPLIDALDAAAKEIQQDVDHFRVQLKGAATAAKDAHDLLVREIDAHTKKLLSDLDQAAASVAATAGDLINQIGAVCERLNAEVRKLQTAAVDVIEDRIKEAINVEALKRDLKGLVDKEAASLADLKAKAAAKAAEIAREAEARVRNAAATIQQSVQKVVGSDLGEAARRAEGVYQKGDETLRLLRAVGDPPHTDSLGFNRPEVAYIFGEAKDLGIDVTPTLALVNRAADQLTAAQKGGKAVGELLDSFGVRLPMTQVADQLIPDKLRNLSVSDLVPHMGGLDLRGLLQRVGFPDLDDSNAVKIRHGFDKAARRAWMEADLDVPFAQSVPLLSFGPVQLVIDTARFTSQARLSASPGSGVERKMNGRVFGDWRVVCGGQSILTFRQTELKFDDSGRIDFQIQPERVELAAALQFITDLMRATGQKGGLRIEPFVRGGVPSGVAATLDMVLPPIQTAAFGISDLSLHVLFGVAALPQFEIVSELAVGSRLTPFSLNVWILAGGGYVVQRLRYLPTAQPVPLLTYTLDISVLAGLGIGFSFGVVSGGVWLQVGCGIAITWTTGAGGNSTTVRVFLLARGNVDVAGLITASIALLFEVSYDGERMIGAGRCRSA
jgi:hypothetical protein